ncbi:sugar phosphate isomerase/epimerase [Actinomycetospora succinea]|uniref:Sugar phosphate isomerase/epimerase n=1 Tax=Actinomycetospora succinea TaxID=663603 RepID=A0A4R6VGQ5_9PSEU|nr:sugar phosphate isomerase/epimerase [Actinomycetospora succinea]TDQ60537.1 sugar phosphate isomerase/epimerase [Actinomycetospora succinea]
MGLRERTDLVASYYTLTGAHLSHPPRHTLADRARAAAAAGFTGMALAPAEAAGGVDAVVAALDGLPAPEIEPLKGWDSGGRDDEAAVFALAGAFSSRQVTTIQLVDDVPDDLLAERFAGLCARAAEHGLTVGFEPRANSVVSTPAQAAALIEASGAAHAGIVLDAYHVHRAGVSLDDLAPHAARVVSIQLNDALARPRPDPGEDATEFRLVPGEGAIDLPAWLDGLDRLGIDVPLAVEALSRENNARSLADAAVRAFAGARAVLAGQEG